MKLLSHPRILAFTLACVAIVCAAMLGYLFGADNRQPVLASALPAGTTSDAQSAEVVLLVAQRERDVAQETVRQLQASLAEATRMADEDKAELDLYRRIASDSTPNGLSIDNVVLENNTLAITLIQARGRKSVSGIVKVAVTRMNDDKLERLILPATEGGDETEFDFRFFETISLSTGAVAGFSPQQLEITVTPSGETYKGFKAEFAWDDVSR